MLDPADTVLMVFKMNNEQRIDTQLDNTLTLTCREWSTQKARDFTQRLMVEAERLGTGSVTMINDGEELGGFMLTTSNMSEMIDTTFACCDVTLHFHGDNFQVIGWAYIINQGCDDLMELISDCGTGEWSTSLWDAMDEAFPGAY